MDAIVLDHATRTWLLDPADPALRARVLVDLLGRAPDDDEVAEARSRIPEQPYVRAALEAWTSGRVRALGPYQKYRGATWTLAHLSEMGLPSQHPVAEAGAAYLMDEAKPPRRVRGREVAPLRGSPAVYWLYPIACLTARMLAVLARFGHADQPAARGARATLVHLHLPGRGLDCAVMDRSLLPGCIMTVPEVLRGLLAVPADERTPAEADMMDDLVAVLRGVQLHRYIPAENAAFRAAAEGLPVDEVRALKAAWASQGRLEPRTEKAGWLRFSFPHSYNADLLEVLWALAEAGTPRDAVIEAGLDTLLSKRTRTGRWKQHGGLNGKMWSDRGARGAEDPWVTFRALTVLRRFGALGIEA